MTLVTSRREPKPRSFAARNGNASLATAPPLARGRDERQPRPRSPILSAGDRQAFSPADVTSPGESVGTGFSGESGTPVSDSFPSRMSVSRGVTFSPTVSEVSIDLTAAATAQLQRKRTLSDSQYSELSVIPDEEHPEKGVGAFSQASRQSRTYPIRIAELLQSEPSQQYEPNASSPTETTLSGTSLASRLDAAFSRRPLQLAPWPAGQPRLFQQSVIREDEVEHPRKKGKGIKTPYKNQEEKNKVKAVRDSGACMRCVIFRQACEVLNEGQRCKACQVVSRKWHIPCTKIWLRDRCWCLLPGKFFDHLQLNNGAAFPIYKRENRTNSFPLKLSKNFGLEIEMAVFAVTGSPHDDSDIPFDKNSFIKLTFVSKEGGMGGRLQKFRELTLPLMPDTTSEAVETIEDAIREYLFKFSQEPHLLPDILFPEDEGQKWVKEVFRMVCCFQERILQGSSQALNLALKTIFVRCLISRTFDIPPDQIRDLNERLPPSTRLHEDDVDILASGRLRICPKYADRFVKAALLRNMKTSLLPDCFSEFEDLFHLMEKDHGKSKLSSLSRDEVFCTTIVVLLLAGICQTKIVHAVQGRIEYNWNNVNDTPDGPEMLYKEAFRCIYEIEHELVDHLLHLWIYQFKKEKMDADPGPHQERAASAAAGYNPIGLFQDSVIAHGDSLARIQLDLCLTKDNLEEFVDENFTRLLLRFNEVLYRPKGRRR